MAAALFCFVTAISAADITFQPIVRLTNNAGSYNGTRVRISVPNLTFARVDASTNLLDWNAFITAGAGTSINTDLFSAFPQRFYRGTQVTNAGTFAGDHFQTSAGDVIVRPVNHAGFALGWNGITILNDPSAGSFTPFPKAQLILVSHDHGDHFNAGTIGTTRATNGVIVAPQAVYNQLSTALKGVTTVLTNGASTNFFGIDIQAIPSYDFDGQHPKGVGNAYVITIGGKKFFMAGDTDDVPEHRALTDIEVAFIPMNSFTMTSQQAAAVVKAFQPKYVYPYHYSDNVNAVLFRNIVLTNSPAVEVRLRAQWY